MAPEVHGPGLGLAEKRKVRFQRLIIKEVEAQALVEILELQAAGRQRRKTGPGVAHLAHQTRAGAPQVPQASLHPGLYPGHRQMGSRGQGLPQPVGKVRLRVNLIF